jgi:activator of HSP90 ATPase
MISILTDIHMADAVYQTRHFSNEKLIQYSESDFYYSILKKHQVADSVFEKSLIYYSGKPKEFEKIYTRVINKLTLMEQEEKKKTQQPLQLEQQE